MLSEEDRIYRGKKVAYAERRRSHTTSVSDWGNVSSHSQMSLNTEEVERIYRSLTEARHDVDATISSTETVWAVHLLEN